jgi:hypothetical protein
MRTRKAPLLGSLAFALGVAPSSRASFGAGEAAVECRFVAIGAGHRYSLALGADGRLWSWGFNREGQLGHGHVKRVWIPVPVRGLTDVTEADGGQLHTVALRSDGTVWAWGDNDHGQLGDGTTMNSSVPLEVRGVVDAFAVGAGLQHSIAANRDGSLSAWGGNGIGELGDGTGVESHVPVKVNTLRAVSAVSAGYRFNLAVESGQLWSWGQNGCGQLGVGDTMARYEPVAVPGMSGVADIAGGRGSSSHALAALGDGTVWAWGSNDHGKLGNGDSGGPEVSTPSQVMDPFTPSQPFDRVIAVAAGDTHSLALRDDGTVWAWGENAEGQVGNGSVTNFETRPVLAATAPPNVVAIAAGLHSLALTGGGEVWAWGRNDLGQLGIGSADGFLPHPVAIRVDFDRVPPDQGNLLRATREGDDVRLTWDLTDPVTASLWRVYADTDKGSLGTTGLAPDTEETTFLDAGAVPRSALEFYRIKGLSRCTLTPGE